MWLIRNIFLFQLCILLLISRYTFANELDALGIPYIENYASKEYKTSVQNWSIVQDDRGIMYFGNNDGILIYDANSWRFMPISNYSAIRSFCKNHEGRIFVGGTKEFGYLSSDKVGNTIYISLTERIKDKNFEAVWRIFALENDVYFFAGREIIYRYNIKTDSLSEIYKPVDFNEIRGFKFDNQIYVTSNNSGLGKIIGDSVQQLNILSNLCSKNIYTILKTNDNKILIGTRNDGFFFTNHKSLDDKDIEFREYANPLNEFLKESQIYSSTKLRNDYFVVTTLKGGIILFDPNGNPVAIYNEASGIISNSVYKSYEDLEGNLWLAMEEGISKIELNSPLRRFDEHNGLNGSFLTIEEYNSGVFIGTSLGVYYLNEKDQNDIFVSIKPLSEEYIYNLDYAKISNKAFNKQWLIGSSLRYIFLLNENHSLTNLMHLYGCYSILQSSVNEEDIFLGHTRGIHRLKFNISTNGNPTFHEAGEFENFSENVRHMVMTEEGNLWITSAYNGLFYIEMNGNEYKNIYHYTTENGLPALNSNYVYFIDDELIITTTKKVMTVANLNDDPGNYYFIEDTLFGLNNISDSIYFNRLFIDDSIYWFGTNKGVIKLIFDTNRQPIIISTPFKRYKDIEVEALMVDQQNRLWYGARSDLFIYNPDFIKSYNFDYQVYFRKIILNKDSLIYNGGDLKFTTENVLSDKLIVDYHHNSIRFEFSAPFFQDEYSTTYKYYLDGYDDTWTDWSPENKITYTNLNEGEYKLLVKAKNVFDVQSPTSSFEFVVEPPWYRSIAAYLFYVIILIVLIYLSVSIYTRKLKAEKKKLEELISRRTKEIEQQKEEIKAQSEQLLKTNEELEKLSIVAKKTNNAVVIMDNKGNFEWVNEAFEQLYKYTLDEFVKEVSPNIKTASRDEEINKEIQRCFDEKVPVTYEFHTITKYANDVYVQTSLTPILDENGNIFKLVAIDSDISKLKKAEREIIKQQEQLKLKSIQLEKTNKELEKLSIVARETDNAIAILDNKGNYKWINEGYTRLYGFTFEQLVKEKDRHIIGANSNLKLSDLASIWYGDKKSIIYESVIERRDGKKIWTQTTLTPIVDEYGSIMMLVAIDSDITELKEAEEKIEAQKLEIEAQRDLAIKQRDEISLQKQEIIDSIIYAKRIQNAIFPSAVKINEIFQQNFILYRPRDIVSGDFYWFSETELYKIAAIADCTGHGVPGAFMSIIGITFLNEIVNINKELQANEILNQLRSYVISSLKQTGQEGEPKDGMDISIVIYEKNKNKIQFAGANNSLFLVRNKELIEYKADKMPISLNRMVDQPFVNNNIKLQNDDLIYLFTDGFADQFGGLKGKKYKIQNFKNLLVSISDLELKEQKKILNKSFDEWKGRLEQVDDILVMGIRF